MKRSANAVDDTPTLAQIISARSVGECVDVYHAFVLSIHRSNTGRCKHCWLTISDRTGTVVCFTLAANVSDEVVCGSVLEVQNAIVQKVC